MWIQINLLSFFSIFFSLFQLWILNMSVFDISHWSKCIRTHIQRIRKHSSVHLPSLQCLRFYWQHAELVVQPSMGICVRENWCQHIRTWQTEKTKNEWIKRKLCRRAANCDRMVSNALRCDPTQSGYMLASNAINFYFFGVDFFRPIFDTYTSAIITNDYVPSFAIHFQRIYFSHADFNTQTICNSTFSLCVRPPFPLAADFVWNRWLMSKTQRVSSQWKRLEQFPISRTQVHHMRMRKSNCQCCQTVIRRRWHIFIGRLVRHILEKGIFLIGLRW